MNVYSVYTMPKLAEGKTWGFVRPEFVREVTADTSWEARKLIAAERGVDVTDVMARALMVRNHEARANSVNQAERMGIACPGDRTARGQGL